MQSALLRAARLALRPALSAFSSAGSRGEKTVSDAIGFVSEPYLFSYDFKEVISYNLAVGASTTQQAGLRYLYEDEEGFCPLPTFGVIPALSGTGGLVTGSVPGLNIDLQNVLHGRINHIYLNLLS